MDESTTVDHSQAETTPPGDTGDSRFGICDLRSSEASGAAPDIRKQEVENRKSPEETLLLLLAEQQKLARTQVQTFSRLVAALREPPGSGAAPVVRPAGAWRWGLAVGLGALALVCAGSFFLIATLERTSRAVLDDADRQRHAGRAAAERRERFYRRSLEALDEISRRKAPAVAPAVDPTGMIRKTLARLERVHEERMKEARSDIVELKQKVEKLSAELTRKDRRLILLENQLAQERAVSSAASRALARLRARVQSLKAENKSLRDRLELQLTPDELEKLKKD